MNIAVVGTGYVGLVVGRLSSPRRAIDVIGADVDAAKIDGLTQERAADLRAGSR